MLNQQTLIDDAVRLMASEVKLAKALGVSTGNVNDWHHNRRACPVKYVRQLALMLGLDVVNTVGEVELSRLGEVGQRPNRGAVETLRTLGVGVVALAVAVGERVTMYRLSTQK